MSPQILRFISGDRKKAAAHEPLQATAKCPRCGYTNQTGRAERLLVEMRPILSEAAPVFPDALATVECLLCNNCSYRICLDYWIELDDNPEMDINEDG